MNHPVPAIGGTVKVSAISDTELTAIAGAIVSLSDYQRSDRYVASVAMYTQHFRPMDYGVSKALDNGFLDGYVQGYLTARREFEKA